MAVTFFEEGVEKGREKGIVEGVDQGKREMVKLMLEDRFGTLTKRISELIDGWPEKSFRKLGRLAREIESLDELVKAGKQR